MDSRSLTLMTYAQFPELRCPLTLDQDALRDFLLDVDLVTDRLEDGTAIGVALAKAVAVLEQSDVASKVVILLTDGENNIDNIMPMDAARLALDASVRVHTIGIGRENPSVFGLRPADFSELAEIASMTGGRFFVAPTEQVLAQVYAAIDELDGVWGWRQSGRCFRSGYSGRRLDGFRCRRPDVHTLRIYLWLDFLPSGRRDQTGAGCRQRRHRALGVHQRGAAGLDSIRPARHSEPSGGIAGDDRGWLFLWPHRTRAERGSVVGALPRSRS